MAGSIFWATAMQLCKIRYFSKMLKWYYYYFFVCHPIELKKIVQESISSVQIFQRSAYQICKFVSTYFSLVWCMLIFSKILFSISFSYYWPFEIIRHLSINEAKMDSCAIITKHFLELLSLQYSWNFFQVRGDKVKLEKKKNHKGSSINDVTPKCEGGRYKKWQFGVIFKA